MRFSVRVYALINRVRARIILRKVIQMKQVRKSLALLLALMMCLSLLTIGGLAAGAEFLDGVDGKLVIIHTNDVHGRDVANSSQYGTAAVAQLKKDFEAAGAQVLLLSAGDAIQGLPLVNYDFGATAIEFLSLAGYDALSPGNHEFDWGAQNLFDILENANFPVLSANIIFTEGNEYGGIAGGLVFPGNEIFELGGLKVGVFGLTTPETYTKAHPDKVKGIAFLQGKEMFDAAQKQVDFLTAEGCDIIICLGHLGIDDESMGNRSLDLIEAVDGIDLFIDGHSHTVLANGRQVGSTLLASAGTALANIGVVVYDPGDGSLTASLLGIAGGVKAYDGLDEELNAIINARNAEVEEELKAVIGTTENLLLGVQPEIRSIETNLGNFATDALLWCARKVLGEGNVDAAITNGGGIRASIPSVAGATFPYNITMKDMVTVFPFGNTVATVEVTGAQLLEALEAATFSSPGVVGAFPQVSGIEFEIHNYNPYERGEQYSGSTYYAPANPGSRVKNVKVGGEPLDLAKTYVLATNDFTAAGGDTYSVFKDKSGGLNTGVAMEQALMDYLAEELGGVLGAKYAGPQGRIKVYFMDVASDQWWSAAFKYVFLNGIIGATSNNTWEPTKKVDVATAVEAMYNIEGRPEAEGENFNDVKETDWFYDSVLWAKNIGLVEGDDNGEFRGTRNITRAEQAAVFVNYLEIMGYKLEAADISGFADVAAIPGWAADKKVLEKMLGSGIMQGRDDNTLAPNDTAVRYELAKLITNVVEWKENYGTAEGTVAALIYGGNLELDITGQVLFARGFRIGDIVTVKVGDFELDMPFCPNYNDVDIMDNLVRLSGGRGASPVIVAINMSAFALKYGGAVGDSVYFTLKESGGYLSELANRPAETGRTNNREDYASDQIFANFREVTLGDIAPGVLYRSSSPVNNGLGRAAYVDVFCKEAGINTIINLADNASELDVFFAAEDFNSPYYKSLYEAGGVIPLKMGVDFFYDPVNRALYKQGFEFLLDNEGPYLIHCTEGKDRVGFTFAMLEALMGATIEEIKDDYMQTYINYFHFEKGTEEYERFAASTVMQLMCLMAGVDKGTDLSGVDMVEAAYVYLLGIGLEKGQIDKLVTILSGKDVLSAAA